MPAAVCVTAFLVSVSRLATKKIACVSAAETQRTETVEPLQNNEGETGGETEIPEDIADYPVATFSVSGDAIDIVVDLNDEVYYRFDDSDDYYKVPCNNDSTVTVTGSNLTLFSKGSVDWLNIYTVDSAAISSADVTKLTTLKATRILIFYSETLMPARASLSSSSSSGTASI